MPTPLQLAANIANAQKSTGPRSAMGKAASRLNALKTGIHADSTIIVGEDPEALTQLAESFYLDHQPGTAMERTLLDNVIRDTWLLARFARIDSEIIDYEIEEAMYKKDVNQAGRAFIDSSTHQIRLQRRIDATRKSQIQAFKEFQRLQAERHAQPPAPQPQPPSQPLDVTAVPAIPRKPIGFDPQTPPEPASVPPQPASRIGNPVSAPLPIGTPTSTSYPR